MANTLRYLDHRGPRMFPPAKNKINGIPLQEAKRASKIDRQAIKQKIRAYKSERDAAIEDKDKGKLKRLRNRTKALRRKLVRNA